MRASRLVSLLLLLQSRGRMTAHALAGELEVSVRTVYRDVESLHAAGVPIVGDAGPDGGYRLLDGYRTRLTGLTGDEAESLFLTGLPGPAAELGLGAAVAAASLKLRAALPAELADRAGRIAGRFHLDAPSWYREPDPTPHLAAVADAVWNERLLRIRYHRWKAPQEVNRTLAPYGLVLKAGRWYLVARGTGRLATYRVSQIRELWSLDDRFDRPPDFDLTAYWRSHVTAFEASRHRGEATIRISPEGMAQLPDVLPDAMVRAVAANGAADERPGWTRATVPTESVDHTVRELLRLGGDVEVLGPAELRDRMIDTIVALTQRYGITGSRASQDALSHR
ncbi:YafY family protein [Actinophytocola sp.]|uniref:helix-turn-helix transcriptional regulator n=1 Tax=Actinophytocola sp. TaxID=1872138 RepID=UPI002D7F3415|nr:YafY family protein [Actinophytocola sp.]HET9143304.1 YafY family protein [Actinophytocola sp.]